jgi:hypothetical protein
LSTTSSARIIKAVESEDFSDRLLVASSLEAFIRILQVQPEVAALVEELKANSETLFCVIQRIDSIASLPIDESFANPKDVVLATYALAAASAYPAIRREVAALAATAAKTWWAQRISGALSKVETPLASANETIAATSTPGPISGFPTTIQTGSESASSEASFPLTPGQWMLPSRILIAA